MSLTRRVELITYPLPRFDQQKSEVMQRYQILNGSDAFDTNHTARTAALVFGAPIVVAALNERYRDWFRSAHGVDDKDYDRLQDFCALANLSEDAFVVQDARAEDYFARDPAVLGSPNVAFFAGAPLRDPDGKRFGTLCVIDNTPRAMTESQLSVLRSFAGQLSGEICLRSAGRYALRDLIEVEEDKCALYDLAMTDPLTRALNRRAFFNFTEREVRRAHRHKLPLSTLMIDIDHFKKVNDVHGHAAGDEVLKTMVAEVTGAIRDEDLVGRLGGEEFAIVLPETPAQSAKILADRLRNVVKSQKFYGDGGAFSISISVGITELVSNDLEIDGALERADKALYEAKRNGRDRVEIADAPEGQFPLTAVANGTSRAHRGVRSA